MAAWRSYLWGKLALATLHATFCVSAMLKPHRALPARINCKPGSYHCLASAQRNLGFLHSRPSLQLTQRSAAPAVPVNPLRRTAGIFTQPARRESAWASAVLHLSGLGDEDAGASGDGVGLGGEQPADNSTGSSKANGVATDEVAAADFLRTETQRLMSAPTIDIKLELQMRGVEHRDAFEKVDLARRLAEARASCPSLADAAPEDKNVTDDSTRATEEKDAARAAPTAGGSVLYDRDVAKATRMGKAAVTRELNAMGIAHSRLSDVTDLARLYASGRREAREDAEAARRFPRAPGPARSSSSGDVDERKDNGRRGSRTRGEKEGEGSDWQGGKEGGDQWSSARQQWSTVTSGLYWNADEEEDEDKDGEEEGGRQRPAVNGVDRGGLWNEEAGESTRTGIGGGRRDESEAGWSVGANAGGTASSRGGGGGDKGRSREASLHARADRMSSRELMKALDELGTRYRIPAPRLELQQAFVSAVLAGDQRHLKDAAGKAQGDQGREKADIVLLSPYATTENDLGELDGRGYQRKSRAGFGTYHSALRWARQLNFDDVLEELRHRGVEFDPRADYSYLTLLLADEVLADEELMQSEGVEGAYRAELGLAMSRSAQEIIRELRAGGERVDVTLSKEALAEQLADMNLRLRAESPPETAGGNVFNRRRRPEDRVRDDNVDRDVSRRERKGFESFVGLDGSADDEDILLELGEAAKSVAGATLLVARETAAFVSQAASGLFPDAVSARDEREELRRRRRRQAGRAAASPSEGSPGDDDGGDRARVVAQARRARAVRERAGGVGRAATGFAQNSVNRAGFAVAQSVVNGVLKGAEAAADWAGDGALAREYVLLIVAAFCLVFKRGVGAAVALLILIRFGRVTAQRLVAEGWKVGRSDRVRARDVGDGTAVAAGGGGGATAYRRRDTPSARYAASSGGTDRRPRRSKASRTEGRGRRRRKNAKTVNKRTSARSRSGRAEKSERKPLWDSDSENEDRGCVVS